MRNVGRAWVFLAATLITSSLTACSGEKSQAGKDVSEILSDKDAGNASNAFVRLQEQPSFPVDEGKKAFAVMSDRDKRAPASDKPMGLDESKVRK